MFHHNSNNPIIELLLIRNDAHYKFPDIELIRQDPVFDDLPRNTKAEISSLNDSINSHKPFKESLLSMPFRSDYNPKVIEIFHNNSEQRNLTDLETFCFLFQCLSWISLDSQNQTADSLINLIEIFKSTLKSNFTEFSNAIFQELVIFINSIQKESLFKILIDPIVYNIEINKTLQKSFYPTFLEFITKIQNMEERSVFKTIIPVLATLVAEQRKIFEYESLRDLANLISKEIDDLDMNALYVLCFCAHRKSDDEKISDLFLKIPHIIYKKLLTLPIVNSVSDFVFEAPDELSSQCSQATDNSKISPDQMVMPSQAIVENRVNTLSLCDPYIQTFIVSFSNMLKLCEKHSLYSMLTSLHSMKEIIFRSDHCIDMIVVNLLILKAIVPACNVHSSIGLILNQFTFSDDLTIFTKSGLTDAVNRIRNDVFEFLVKNDMEGLTEFFIRSSSRPLLYAELLTRATYQVPLPNEFFSSSVVLPSLIGSAMLILQSNFPDYVDKANLAKSIIFNVLFRLFDEPKTALSCFENHIFTTGFMSLIFEPGFARLIVRSLSDCLAKFPILPEPVSLFIASLFKMCSLHHDENLSSIATNLAHEIIKSISHNVSIGQSFEPVFDSALEFLQIDPTPEMLESVLSMLLLIAQANLNLLVNSTRFNNILNLIHSVEGDEPSENTFLKMQNLMSASTNLALNMMFLVRIPSALALVLIAFSKSKRLVMFLETLMKLCTFSISNVYACHEGDIDLILLKSLFGSFTYKKRKVEFLFDDTIIETHVMKLISQIVWYRSSFSIDNLFLSLLLPNESGEYSKYSSLAINTLNSIFLNMSTMPSPTYPISSSTPYMTYNNFNHEGLDKSFVFAFYCYIDEGLCMVLPYTYYFLRIKDSRNHTFSVFYHKKGMYARFEGNGFRTSAPLCRDLPSNEWIFCIILYEEDNNEFYITMKIGKEDNEEVDFKKVDLQTPPNEPNKIQCSLCFLEDKNNKNQVIVIPADQPAPIMMGQFALITGFIDTQTFESLRIHGFDALSNLDLSKASYNMNYTDKNLKINYLNRRQDLSIRSMMIKHVKIESLLPIFAQLEKAPKLYAESIINAMSHCIDFSNVVYTDTTPSEDEADYLNSLAEIQFNNPLPDFPRELQNLSSISVLAYLILTNSRELINFQLFSAFFSLSFDKFLKFNGIENNENNVPIAKEFIENVLFSPFYWCSVNPNHMKRISNKWCNAITRGFKQANEVLFETFLVQSHLLVNFSKKKEIEDTIKVLSTTRFQSLEAFAMTKSNDSIVSLVVGMIFSITAILNEDTFEKVRTEVLRYINFMIFMSETRCKAFVKDTIISLLELIDIFPNDVDIFTSLMYLYQKADTSKTMQRVTQLSIRFFTGLKVPVDTSNFPLDVQLIRAVICGDNDEEAINALKATELSSLTFMWYFWPTIVGLVRPKTMVSSIEFLSKYPKEFEPVLSLFTLLKVFHVFKMKDFRKHYIETLAKRVFVEYVQVSPSQSNCNLEDPEEFTAMSPFQTDLYQKEETNNDASNLPSDLMNPLSNLSSFTSSSKTKEDENEIFSKLVLPFFLSHFYKYSSKPFSSQIITEMAKNSDIADISNLEQWMKIEFSTDNKVRKVSSITRNGYNYPTGTFDIQKLIEIMSISPSSILKPLNIHVVFRPAESLTLYELCKDLNSKLHNRLSIEQDKISLFLNTQRNSPEYTKISFDIFTYFEKNLIRKNAQESLLKTVSNIKEILIGKPDRSESMKKYEKSVDIQRKHFYEFVTYGRVKSQSLLSHNQSNFLNTSYHLSNPFIELIKKSSSQPESKENSALTQITKLEALMEPQQKFILSFQAELLKFDDHFDNSQFGTKVVFELFSDRIILEFYNKTPLTIFFDMISMILTNKDGDDEIDPTGQKRSSEENLSSYLQDGPKSPRSPGGVRSFLKNLGFSKKQDNPQTTNQSQDVSSQNHKDVLIEIFTMSLQSYLLKISYKNKSKLVKKNAKLNLPIVERNNLFILNDLVPAWDNGLISTFDFLLSLSIWQGRSFNTVENYPFFPSPSIFNAEKSTGISLFKKSDQKETLMNLESFSQIDYTKFIEEQVDLHPEFLNSESVPIDSNSESVPIDPNIKVKSIDVMPEFYYKFGWDSMELNGKNPYQNRKDLETIDFRKIIGRYSTNRYGKLIIGVPKFTVPKLRNSLPSKTITPSPFVNIGTSVRFDRLLAILNQYENRFVTLEDNGSVSLHVIDWDTFKFIKQVNYPKLFFTESVICASEDNFIIFYDMALNKMLKMVVSSADYAHPQQTIYSCPILISSKAHIKIIDDLVIAVSDKTSIISCPVSTFPKFGFRLIYDNKEDEIVKIEVHKRVYCSSKDFVSKSNGLIVFLTKSGVIKCVSLSSGILVGEFSFSDANQNMKSGQNFHDIIHIINQNSFDDGKKIKILITESLSLILVAVGLQILVFTPEMKLIKSAEIVKPVISWISYLTFDGIDSIVYLQSDYLLCSFEAFFPEKIRSIEYLWPLSASQSQSLTNSQSGPITNLAFDASSDNLIMKHIHSKNMIVVISVNGLIYTHYLPKITMIPTLSL